VSGNLDKALQEAMAAAAKEVEENQASDSLYGIPEGRSPLAPWPKRPCKIVFLDFDGVLNSEMSNRALGTRYKFAEPSVEALNQILLESRSYVVITSSWRGNWTLRENAVFLQQAGVMPICVLGKTSMLNDLRGREIELWLQKVPFAVESFVILDDRMDMEPYQDRLVLIDSQSGLDQKHIEKAVRILNQPWKH
jgi:hypothetical protein